MGANGDIREDVLVEVRKQVEARTNHVAPERLANDLVDELQLSDAEAGLALVLARHCHKRQSPIQGNYWRSLED